MGLLERLKLNKTKDFFEWLDLILKNELNSEIKAINFNLYESDWELVETFFIGLVNEYLSSGKYAGKLKEYQAIGIGFVDGDLHILYAR